MNKVQHRSNNSVLGAPSGWDQKSLPCDALPVTRTHMNGQPAIVSYWRPTPAEIQALIAGACVQLWIIGQTHPPVAVEVSV